MRRLGARPGLPKEHGYAHGIAPGLQLFEACRARGVKEVSVYGFTQTIPPAHQRKKMRFVMRA
jgi:undecaprenyl diphosphate synthase